jgi:hypothetical protein
MNMQIPIKKMALPVIILLLLIAGVTIATKDRKSATYSVKTTEIIYEEIGSKPQTSDLKNSPARSYFIMADTLNPIEWFTVTSGVVEASSASYEMKGSAAQSVVGLASSASYDVSHSMWFEIDEPTATVACGDVNEDDAINIKDITYLIKYKYKGGAAPIPYECVGDVNKDASVNIKDITYLIKYKYKGGGPPDAACCSPVW